MNKRLKIIMNCGNGVLQTGAKNPNYNDSDADKSIKTTKNVFAAGDECQISNRDGTRIHFVVTAVE